MMTLFAVLNFAEQGEVKLASGITFAIPKAIAHATKGFFCHFEALSLTAHNLSYE